MNNFDFLTALKLTPNEALVYRTLLALGPSSPTAIEKQAKLHRPLVYQAIKNLLVKTLIKALPKGKRVMYQAENPDTLISLFKKLENQFINGLEDLHKLAEKPKGSEPKVTFTKGERAIRHAMMDVIESLPKGGIYYRYSPGYEKFDYKRFLPHKYKTMRDQKKLERLVIVNDIKNKPKKVLGRDTRAIPRTFDLFGDQVSVIIYGSKVAIIDYLTESVITITDPKFATFQTKIFKFIFSKLN